MANSRIFIAVNFPQKIKEKLIFYQKKWKDLPVRWTKEKNLHLTLIFIGCTADERLPGVLNAVENIAGKSQPFSISFQKICLGPPNKAPRMFWVKGQKSQELILLKSNLEIELSGVKLTRELREFRPHITLGRIKMLEWRNFSELPIIDEKISLDIPVDSIEIMESQLKKEGPEYTILKSYKLRL